MSDAAGSLFDVSGRVTLVTGAASGIGLAMAEVMATGGATVVMADIDAAGLEREAQRLRAAGGRVQARVLDIARGPDVHAAVEAIVAEHGRLDVAFANAGVSAGPSFAQPEGRLDAVSPEHWARMLEINLTGAFETLRAAAKPMRQQRDGRIVVTASISGMKASPVSGYAYVAAKAALINLVRQAAAELGPDGVLVNAIAPGFIVTNLASGRLRNDPAAAAALAESVPLRRVGTPGELKGLALFLASPASSYVTGAIIPVDGGVTAT
ncbi:SDR family NAD(P)-dependent oxidoreductase [Roseomonas sp. BN140053]|uniref:SDR family NAD(P)-dependent oxidoreductase n=1 Tax=Roseomonas sp. BN140053 TaxID=3391898 RepID=UPI0039ECF168